MLSYLNMFGIREQLLTGRKANRIFRAIECVSEITTNVTNYSTLVFYTRDNGFTTKEAGIYYGPGPSCFQGHQFPSEILRLFSLDEDFFEAVYEYYLQLVDKNSFYRVVHKHR